jgi:hypothetical protein
MRRHWKLLASTVFVVGLATGLLRACLCFWFFVISKIFTYGSKRDFGDFLLEYVNFIAFIPSFTHGFFLFADIRNASVCTSEAFLPHVAGTARSDFSFWHTFSKYRIIIRYTIWNNFCECHVFIGSSVCVCMCVYLFITRGHTALHRHTMVSKL